MASFLKSNIVLYETPTGSVYKTLDIETGNMHALEVIEDSICKQINEYVHDEISEAIYISNTIINDFEPAHRHVMLYTTSTEIEKQDNNKEDDQNVMKQEIQEQHNNHMDDDVKIEINCEYISGNSLKNLISSFSSDNVLSIHVIQSYTWQILQGIHQLHRVGRYHGSLSPENVRFDRLGNLKLTSWWLDDISICRNIYKASYDGNKQLSKVSKGDNSSGSGDNTCSTSSGSGGDSSDVGSSGGIGSITNGMDEKLNNTIKMCENLELVRDVICCLSGLPNNESDDVQSRPSSFYIHFDAFCLGLIILNLTIISAKFNNNHDIVENNQTIVNNTNDDESFLYNNNNNNTIDIMFKFKTDIRDMLNKNPPPVLSALIFKKIISSHVPTCYHNTDTHDFIEKCFIKKDLKKMSINNNNHEYSISEFQYHPFLQKVRGMVDCEFIDKKSSVNRENRDGGGATAQASHHGVEKKLSALNSASKSSSVSQDKSLSSTTQSSSHKIDRTPAQRQFLKRLGSKA